MSVFSEVLAMCVVVWGRIRVVGKVFDEMGKRSLEILWVDDGLFGLRLGFVDGLWRKDEEMV
jgi:hypothetical protein